MYRCINDIFGFCYGKPQPTELPGTKVTFDYMGREHHEEITTTRCINHHRTCSYYQSQNQRYQLNSPSEEALSPGRA